MNNINLIFDFDSTLIKLEGLDELAKISLQSNPDRQDIVKKIEDITKLGMKGEISFQESLSRRLELIQIQSPMIDEVVELLKNNMSESILAAEDFFKSYSDNIYVVSGGFREWVEPVSNMLGIKSEHIFANKFHFDENKNVIGYDKSNYLSQSQGKVNVINELGLKRPIVMIGDGYTDYEVRKMGAADIFISYTENISRDNINEVADYIAQEFTKVPIILEEIAIAKISS